MHIVQNIDRDVARLSHGGFGQFAARPCLGVHISADGNNWGYFAELRQDAGIPDVACVDDQFGSAQRGQRFFAQQSVCVGNQTDLCRCLAHASTISRWQRESRCECSSRNKRCEYSYWRE